jgi:hypothetical protein
MPRGISHNGLGTLVFDGGDATGTTGFASLGTAFSNFSMTVIWSGSSTQAKAVRLRGANTTAGTPLNLILSSSSGAGLAKSTGGYACNYIQTWSTALGSTANPWTYTAYVTATP